jgi:hypothetical protein
MIPKLIYFIAFVVLRVTKKYYYTKFHEEGTKYHEGLLHIFRNS